MQRQRFESIPFILLWVLGLSAAVVSVGVGLRIPLTRYDAARSTRTDPVQAGIEEAQNNIVAKALNRGQLQYHPNMAALVRPRSAEKLFAIDLVRMFLASALPVILVGGLIHKTCARRACRSAPANTAVNR